MDKLQKTVHENFSPDGWLGKPENVQKVIEWNTYFRRNFSRFAETYFEWSMYWYQKILLYLMGVCHLFVLIAARASAKSYVLGMYACIRATLYPGSRIVIAAKAKRQAQEIVSEKIKIELMRDSTNLRHEVEYIKDNANDVTIKFHNGSTIKAVVANENARGLRATVLIAEEARLLDKNLLDTIFAPMLIVRQVPYMKNQFYSEIAVLREEPQQIYITSSWTKSHWLHDIIEGAARGMCSGSSAYLIALDYVVTLMHNIRTRRQLILEKAKLDPLSWAMEYENLMPAESNKAYFTHEMLMSRQTLTRAFYPRQVGESVKTKLRNHFARQEGEVRVVVADIAIMGGNVNDNSAFVCMRFLPETVYSEEDDSNKSGYRVQIPYIEAFKGGETRAQTIRIKQIMYDWNADYLVLDARNVGLSIYDLGARALYDEERGIEYAPWLCMNNEEIAKRINSRVADPNVYCVIATPKLNNDIAITFRQMLVDGKVDLLVNANDGVEELRLHMDGYMDATPEEKAMLEFPYLETMVAIHETVQLTYERAEQTGLIKLKEPPRHTKDRYTAFSYGCFFASELERDLLSDGEFDYSALPGCVSAFTW